MMKRMTALCLSALLLMAGCTYAESVTEQITEVNPLDTQIAQNTGNH